jgi:hypothetical protein
MEKIFSWVKEHKFETGALVLVGLVAVYFLLEGSSSSAASGSQASSADNSAADYYNAQLQAQQLANQNQQASAALTAQTNAQNLQASVENTQTSAQLAAVQDQDSSAVQAAQIAATANTLQTQMEADVATDNIGAQESVENAQTAAQVSIAEGGYNVQNTAANDQLAAISDQIGGQIQQAQIAANVANTVTAGQVQENQDNLASVLGLATAEDQMNESEAQDALTGQEYNDSTAVALSGQQYAYDTDEVDDATDVNLTALQDQTQLDTQAAQNQYSLSSSVIGDLTANNGLSRNDSQLETVVGGIDAALGDVPGSEVGASSGASVANVSSQTEAANIKTATSGVASIVAGLFA